MAPENPLIHSVRIAAVLVTYNSLDDLQENFLTWQSALSSFRTRFYIVDNNSSDGSQEFLTSLTAVTPALHIRLNDKNAGYTAAINQGIRMSEEFDYLLLLNPDIKMPESVISILLAELERFPDTGLVAPQMRFPNNVIQPSCRRFPHVRDLFFEWLPERLARHVPGLKQGWKMDDFDHCSSREVEQPMGAFLLLRRQVLKQIGLLDERFFMFFSDVDFCRRVLEHGWKIRFCADAFVFHTKGASIRKQRQKMIVSSHRSFVDYLAKYHQQTIMQKFGILVVTFLLLVILIPRLMVVKSDRE
jgi:N-acetylglucosaminyl-diphospho-decaprenol L-rhamnosyltransferase